MLLSLGACGGGTGPSNTWTDPAGPFSGNDSPGVFATKASASDPFGGHANPGPFAGPGASGGVSAGGGGTMGQTEAPSCGAVCQTTGACKSTCTTLCNSILSQATADCVQTSIPGYFDIALRDLGLALGAIALSRLAMDFESK